MFSCVALERVLPSNPNKGNESAAKMDKSWALSGTCVSRLRNAVVLLEDWDHLSCISIL